MKTEFLKGLGLSDEQIQKVMAENGKDVEAHKARLTAKEGELSAANLSIQELQAKISAFDGVDIAALKKQAADWEQKYNQDMAALRLSAALDTALLGAKARNPKAVRALLDTAGIKLDGDKLLGLEGQLAKLKETDPYLFEPAAPLRTGMRQTGTEGTGDKLQEANAALRAAFGRE